MEPRPAVAPSALAPTYLRPPNPTTRGAAVLRIGGDVLGFGAMLSSLPMLFLALTSMFGGVATLLVTMGPSSLVGVGLMFVITIGAFAMSGKGQAYMVAAKAAGDIRVGVMRDTIDGVKVVKAQCWCAPARPPTIPPRAPQPPRHRGREDAYLSRLDRRRAVELKALMGFRLLFTAAMQFGRVSPIIGAALGFVTLAASSPSSVTPELVFPALAVFQARAPTARPPPAPTPAPPHPPSRVAARRCRPAARPRPPLALLLARRRCASPSSSCPSSSSSSSR